MKSHHYRQHLWLILLLLLPINIAFADCLNAGTGADNNVRIVFLGDSLTAGYGVPKNSAFVSLTEQRLVKEYPKTNFQIVMAGISGSTTASGLSRLRWHLRNPPQVLMIALGANDGMRGFDIDAIQKNLSQVIEMALQKNIQVVLAGMQALPNYGKNYAQQFENIYTQLAKKYPIQFMPFLLTGVAGIPTMNLSDGIHPNAKGHQLIAENLYPYLTTAIATLSNCK